MERLNRKHINVIEWPIQSVDLNPDRKIYGRNSHATVKIALNLLGLESFPLKRSGPKALLCANLVINYEKNLTAVLTNKGFSVKYKVMFFFRNKYFHLMISINYMQNNL